LVAVKRTPGEPVEVVRDGMVCFDGARFFDPVGAPL
jgi:hypothetical protein